ncbi:MAG: DnaJ domain-containing protein [Bacteroidota bacterium]
MFKDYYHILEVDREASQPEIKKSYRKLAKEHHPDSNPNPDGSEYFLLINEAYQVLSDAESRKSYNNRYDQIYRVKRARKKKENSNIFTEAFSKEPVVETYEQQAYTPPKAEPQHRAYQESYQEAFDFSEAFRSYPPPEDKDKKKKSRPSEGSQQKVKVHPLSKIMWVGKVASVICLLFTFTIITDYFMSEASEVQVMLEARLTTGPDDKLNCVIKTDKSEFPIDYDKYGFLGKGDRLITYTTPIYKVMNSVEIVEGRSIWPHYGIYNAFSIFIFALLVCTSLGILSKDPLIVFRLGITNVILALITALILFQS